MYQSPAHNAGDFFLKPVIQTNMKHLLKLELPLYYEKEVERVMSACKQLDLTGKQLLEQALAEFLDNHGL